MLAIIALQTKTCRTKLFFIFSLAVFRPGATFPTSLVKIVLGGTAALLTIR
jgi:hypothetical protein